MNIFNWIKQRKIELQNQKNNKFEEINKIDAEIKQLQMIDDYIRPHFIKNVWQEVFDKYMQNIEAYCNWRNLDNGEKPDERFMRNIEEQIGISENAKKAFREEILIRSGSYSRKGKEFNYDNHERLYAAIVKYCK